MSKKEIFFITATNTNIGKTKASEIFLKKFAKKGYKVGYYKPFETGVLDIPKDGNNMLKLAKKLNKNFDVDIADVVTYKYKLPACIYVASKGANIDISVIKKQIKSLLKLCDKLVIEGAGGLFVPICKDYFMIDLIKEIKCKTILITPSYLGCINDTLLSQKALKSYGIKYKWYVNLFENKKEFQITTLPFYEAYFKKIKYL